LLAGPGPKSQDRRALDWTKHVHRLSVEWQMCLEGQWSSHAACKRRRQSLGSLKYELAADHMIDLNR
jgi:hypothetical protein